MRSYEVNLEERTCTCPHYQRQNSYPLLKRSGIRVRCKHIFAAERFREQQKGLEERKEQEPGQDQKRKNEPT